MRKRSKNILFMANVNNLMPFFAGQTTYIQLLKKITFSKKQKSKKNWLFNSARGEFSIGTAELLSDTFYEKHVVISPGMLSKDEKDFITRMDFDFENNGKPQDIKIQEGIV